MSTSSHCLPAPLFTRVHPSSVCRVVVCLPSCQDDAAGLPTWSEPLFLQGLPTDDLSIQNGIMVNNAARYPVLVDPQGQARTWILNKEQCNELRVTQLNDRMFRCAVLWS